VVAARKAVQTRNATEEAILDAARAALAEKGFEALTMDAIARKAFVSRTAVYFTSPTSAGRRPAHPAVLQRDVPRGEPLPGRRRRPRRDLRASLARVVAVVNANGGLLLLAAQLSARAASTCRRSGSPTSCASSSAPSASRATRSTASRRRHRPRLSAQALLAMVENHITRELC
jgi:hypothetical protein